LIDRALQTLKLNLLYESSPIEEKQRLITKVFPEKMTQHKGLLRTGRINRIAEYIYLINKKLRGNEGEIKLSKSPEMADGGKRPVRTGRTLQRLSNKSFIYNELPPIKKDKKVSTPFCPLMSGRQDWLR